MQDLHPQGYEPYCFKEHSFGAKEVSYQITVTTQEMMVASSDELFKQEIRKKLVSELVNEIIEQKLVQIVQTDDPIYNGKRIIARLFLLPDTQIRSVREILK